MTKTKKEGKKRKRKRSRSRNRISTLSSSLNRSRSGEAIQDASYEAIAIGGGEGIASVSVPIKLSVVVATSDGANRGLSWGTAFAAASKIQSEGADSDNDVAGNGRKGVAEISELAKGHYMTHKVSRAPDYVDTKDSPGRKRKRKRPESSTESNYFCMKSNDDAGSDGTDSHSSPHRQSPEHKTALVGPSFPYPTNPDDHCETPLRSYKHILPILNELCKIFSVKKHSMKIYDPYFCDGSVSKNLFSLGFDAVYNKKEDCYAVWKSGKEPPFHIFLTNPPYSGDHIEKLIEHLISPSFGERPWMLLMPQWVHKRECYVNATTKFKMSPFNPFYIVPRKRYVYLPPADFREKKESDTHKKSSPFVSMWYCWGGTEDRNKKLIDAFQRSSAALDCDLARSKSALRDLRRRSKRAIAGAGK